MRRIPGLAALILVLSFACALSAQSGFPFKLRVDQGSSATSVANGSTLSLNAPDLAQPVSLTVTATYTGTTSALIPQSPVLLGSTNFGVTGFPATPIKLNPNDAISFSIRFSAASGALSNAQLNVAYNEAPPPGSTISTAGNISLFLTGTVPQLQLSYFLQSDGNVFPLSSGQTITFAPTPTGTNSIAVISIANRGSGTGNVTSAAVSGAAFQALNLPLLPATLEAGQEIRFNIRYQPLQQENSTGSLQVVLGAKPVTVTLAGTSTGAAFSYELLLGGNVVPVAPDGTVSLPNTNIGESVSAAFRVRNIGNGSGTVTSINLIGSGFQASDLPIVPQTLAPNASLLFTITFTPSQAGLSRARLRINNDSFEIDGTGIGVRLTYLYGPQSPTIAVAPSGTIVFSPISVGETSQISFSVRNSGTLQATISSIGILEPRSSFAVSGSPPLPVQINPGESIVFGLSFKPTVTGFSTGTLRIDSQTFSLSGSASTPPALPPFMFSGVSDTVEALQQPGVGLALASPYPIDVTGILTLGFVPDGFSGDPAILFSNGTLMAPFTIPANTTDAIFAGGVKQIRFQTGTVAGTLSLTPSFSTAGGVDLTPASVKSLALRLSPGVPRIITVAPTRTSTGFSLGVTAISTARNLRQIDFQFKFAANFNASTSKFSTDIGSQASAWYLSPQSQPFGSQILITVPFDLSVTPQNLVNPLNPLNALDTVTVTLTNDQGMSAPVTVNVR